MDITLDFDESLNSKYFQFHLSLNDNYQTYILDLITYVTSNLRFLMLILYIIMLLETCYSKAVLRKIIKIRYVLISLLHI